MDVRPTFLALAPDAVGDGTIRAEALVQMVERGLRSPELLQTEAFRRRFGRLVRLALSQSVLTRAEVFDTVESRLEGAAMPAAEALRDLLAASLMPAPVSADAALSVLSVLSGAADAHEAGAVLLRTLSKRFGPGFSGQVWLSTPRPEPVAALGWSPTSEAPVVTLSWSDGAAEIGRLVARGLTSAQQAELNELAPWLQPTFERLVRAAASEAGRSAALREGREWQIRAEVLGLTQGLQSTDAYMRQVVGKLHRLFDAVQVVYWAYDAADDSLEARHHSRPNQPELELPVPAGVFREAVESRQARTAAASDASGEWRVFLLEPVFREETLEGVFQIVLPSGFLDPTAERELGLVGELVASGLQVVRFYEQLSYHASHDPLTELANRRTFQQFIEREFKLSERHGAPISLIMIDVDHFKAYNDAFGHPAGDTLLKAIAGTLLEAVRSTDFVARYGGEEFVIALPHTHREGALAVAAKVLEAVRRLEGQAGPVTASLGVATYPLDAATTDDLLERADQALYDAKRAGRNRVVQAT